MRVAVLGAGLQGACVALELAAHDVQVDLYDRNPQPLMGASLMNEGKIHLGFFYGKDPTLNTARLMSRGALTFAPLLRRWIGNDIDKVAISSPYIYAVHKDSLLTPDEIQGHLQACNRILGESPAGEDDYFGQPYREACTPVEDFEAFFNPEVICAAFETPEIAISAEMLAGFLRAHLTSEPNIRLISDATVTGVAPGSTYVDVEFDLLGERHSERYDQVVNALWDGRLAIDATAGIRPPRPWLFRMKYDLRLVGAPAVATVPPVCVVLGPFGDVVRYANGEMYLSWYPAALAGTSPDLTPPAWPPVLDGDASDEVRRETIAALIDLVPGLREIEARCLAESEVKGGMIFAWGESDITDPASELHTRFDVGPHSYGPYHSIDTGKLTTAPLFASMVCDRILGRDPEYAAL